MNNKIIRLTESDLHRIVKESVKRILKEEFEEYDDGFRPENYLMHPDEKYSMESEWLDDDDDPDFDKEEYLRNLKRHGY